ACTALSVATIPFSLIDPYERYRLLTTSIQCPTVLTRTMPFLTRTIRSAFDFRRKSVFREVNLGHCTAAHLLRQPSPNTAPDSTMAVPPMRSASRLRRSDPNSHRAHPNIVGPAKIHTRPQAIRAARSERHS